MAEAALKQPEEPSELQAQDKTPGTDKILRLLSNYQPAHLPQERRKNVVAGRYVINLSTTIPSLSTRLALAYEVKDEQSPQADLFALICPRHFSYRDKAWRSLLGFSHPNLLPLLASEVVELTVPATQLRVMIFEKPKGQSVKSLVTSSKKPLPERWVAENIIAPLVNALGELSSRNICHGRINWNTVFFHNNQVMLGECVSEPCGFSQEWIFEPLERLLALPEGKGEGDTGMDCYALGVLALYLTQSSLPLAELDRDAFTERVLTVGSYHAFAGELHLSDTMQDLARGTINDNKGERWGLEQLTSWLEGRRFNFTLASLPKDATRAYSFADKDWWTMRALAHAFHRNWEEAKTELRQNRLPRWLEVSAHRKDEGEIMARVIQSGGTTAGQDKQANEMVARAIGILDPVGPLRMQEISCEIDGLGNALASAVNGEDRPRTQYLMDMIENDLAAFQIEQQQIEHGNYISDMLFRIQRTRIHMRSATLGSGMERVLYDLNPHLPCQSPLLSGMHIETLPGLLQGLDTVAREKSGQSSPMDRHIAAFICSRLELMKELKLQELSHTPALATHPEMLMLKLLFMAYEKSGRPTLPGLTSWVGLRLLALTDVIHHRPLREQIKQAISTLSTSGSLAALLEIFMDPTVTTGDSAGFERASKRYHDNLAALQKLQDPALLRADSKKATSQIAMTIAYGWCFFVIYKLLDGLAF